MRTKLPLKIAQHQGRMLHLTKNSMILFTFQLFALIELLGSLRNSHRLFDPHDVESLTNSFLQGRPLVLLADAKGVAGLGKAGGENSAGSDKSGQQVPPEVYIALTYAGTAFLFTLSVPLILYGLNKLLNKVEDCFGCGPSSKRAAKGAASQSVQEMGAKGHTHSSEKKAKELREREVDQPALQTKGHFPSPQMAPDNLIILEAIQKLHHQQQQQLHQQKLTQLPFANSLPNSLSLTSFEPNYQLAPSQLPCSTEPGNESRNYNGSNGNKSNINPNNDNPQAQSYVFTPPQL